MRKRQRKRPSNTNRDMLAAARRAMSHMTGRL